MTVDSRWRTPIAMNVEDTIVAISSPPGSAVRGIVRLSGPAAVEIATRVFTPNGCRCLSEILENTHLDGTIRVAEADLPGSVMLFRGPRSYTRQDMVELHLLGAPGVLALTVQTLLDAGARRAEPGEFTARAFFAGRMDLAQVHGVAAMIAARSDRQLQAAERLLHGALSRTAQAAREELADLLSLVEGAMDFADEPIEFITPDQLRARLRTVADTLQRASDAGLRAERWGRLPQVLLLGAPNVGKSSLLNRLTGMDRAICAPVPGTTRDVLSAPLQWADVECLLIDVAGVDRPRTQIDALAQDAAGRAKAEADLVLHVVDVTHPRSWPSAPEHDAAVSAAVVANKADLLAADRRADAVGRLEALGLGPVCFTSAVTGAGCDALKALIAAALHDRAFDSNDATIALMSDHRQALRGAVEAVRDALKLAVVSHDGLDNADLVALELHTAADRLGRLVGQDLPDDLLGRVFARFCVGK